VENWAEIRRLHRSENIPIKEIGRLLGIARNTVRAALVSESPPDYKRGRTGSLVDPVEAEVRKLLVEFPRMPATVIAERIGWECSITTLKDRIRQIRPEYAGVDPADLTRNIVRIQQQLIQSAKTKTLALRDLASRAKIREACEPVSRAY
jgi:transposase